MIVDHADQPVQLQERVLERRGGQEELAALLQGALDGVGDHLGRLVDVAQPVGLVDHHQIPGRGRDIACLAPGELIGADDDGVLALKWPVVSLADRLVVRLRFQNLAGEEKLLAQLLMPLLAQIGGRDDEEPPPPLGPVLREHQPSLDGLPQTHFVSEQRTFGERGLEREEGGVHLMRIEIDLSASHRRRQLVEAVGRNASGQFMREIFGLVIRESRESHQPRSPMLLVCRDDRPAAKHRSPASP